MDIRLVEDVRNNLQASLSVLDEIGGRVGDAIIGFNEIDRKWRKTATYSASRYWRRRAFRSRNGVYRE
jgi:hypothetical protein